MSLRIVTLLTSVLVFVVILEQKLSLAFPFPEYLLRSQEDEFYNNEDSAEPWDNIDLSHPVPNKRDCAGFPCMYTHLSAKAGRASLKRKIASIINNCLADPHCNPGRRKRSITNAMELLASNRRS